MNKRLTQALIAITMLALAHPTPARAQHSGKAMTANEMISRLTEADEQDVHVIVKLKKGGEVKGYVGQISRQYFFILAEGLGTLKIEYADAYSIRCESRFKIAMRRVRDTAIIVVATPLALPLILVTEGLSLLFTGEGPPSC
jgi:hypothetical protein